MIMFSITVLVSGGGTNLQAIIDSIANGELKDAGVYIKKVISNNKEAFALERAKNNGIETSVISPKDYPDRAAFEVALKSAIDESTPDLIVLAGFLVVIPEAIVRSYPKKIINIHPSLIPSFCGKGYYGLKVHEAALARGVKVTGATVHFVDEGTDTGPIILQKAVEVKEGDTPEVLQQRVMKEAEHILLPHAIALLAKERVCDHED